MREILKKIFQTTLVLFMITLFFWAFLTLYYPDIKLTKIITVIYTNLTALVVMLYFSINIGLRKKEGSFAEYKPGNGIYLIKGIHFDQEEKYIFLLLVDDLYDDPMHYRISLKKFPELKNLEIDQKIEFCTAPKKKKVKLIENLS